MATSRVVGYLVALLVVFYGLKNQGYGGYLNALFEELMDPQASEIHARERREEERLVNSLEYEIQVLIEISDIGSLRRLLNRLELPFGINDAVAITGLEVTTECSPNATGYQCRCGESFAWPISSCLSHGSCDAVGGDTCGCINALPADGRFCQQNSSVIAPTLPPTRTPLPPELLDIDVVLELPSNLVEQLREALGTLRFPHDISRSLSVLSLDLTTECFQNSSGGLQCHCEEQFEWPCDTCDAYGDCGSANASSQTCRCVNGRPADGQFCEPSAGIQPCPTSSPVVTSTTPETTASNSSVTTASNTSMTTASNSSVTTASNSSMTTASNTSVTTASNTSMTTASNTSMTTASNSSVTTASNTSMTTASNTSMTTASNTSMTTASNTSVTTASNTSMTTASNTSVTTASNTSVTTASNTSVTTASNTSMTTASNTSMTTASNTSVTTASNTSVTTASNTSVTTSTTPVTTTSTTPPTTPTNVTTIPLEVPPTVTINEKMLRFTIDIDFFPSYNDASSSVYRKCKESIENQCRIHIPNLQSAEIIQLRSGSTVVDYVVRAPSINSRQVEAVEAGILAELGETYPMLFVSPDPLNVSAAQAFYGETVTLTCGPLPARLNFSADWEAEWKRNGNLILEDNEHTFSRTDNKAMLTVSRFFATDNGRYECQLTSAERPTFRQTLDRINQVEASPQIWLNPIRSSVKCEVGKQVTLQCRVQSHFSVRFRDVPAAAEGSKIEYNFTIPDCDTRERRFTCEVINHPEYRAEATLELSTDDFKCVNDLVFGNGFLNSMGSAPCKTMETGNKTATCKESGNWEDRQDTCIRHEVLELLQQSEFLNNSLPEFLDRLRNVTTTLNEEVAESPNNIDAIVQILSNVANASVSFLITITPDSMEDLLITVGVLTADQAKASWDVLNLQATSNRLARTSAAPESVSSLFLFALERITQRLANLSLEINTPSASLRKTFFTGSFSADFNSSVAINLTELVDEGSLITAITFASMDNVLPPRDAVNSSSNAINGKVALVQSNSTIHNASFTFAVTNETLGNPQCVFWNFTLFDGLGGWDEEGCQLVSRLNDTVTCSCDHLTSFSILMSPDSPDDLALDVITFIGVGLSMASLVICLIIEAVVWRKIRRNNTSYLRHVTIVNIAVSLLIANIWFIIGAAISEAKQEDQPACRAATFFIHLFYLSLFFWMLASALLLLYRTVSVFDAGLSNNSMLAIGFSLGYGAPLIIATVTIAVTAPGQTYIRSTGVCWLNWYESKALLAFVIPALLIVLINAVILLVVIFKMLRRRTTADAAQAAERHVLVVIARSLAVLTPFFGLTWGLGVGTMTSPKNRGIHIAFAFFNSLQGFFILVFGTLLDKKVRSEIAIKTHSSSGATGAGNSASTGLLFFRNWRRKRDGYNLSSNNSAGSHSINT